MIFTVPPTAPSEVNELTVMTYNIHLYYSEGTGGENNLVEVANLIAQSGAQIIGLQESDGNRMVSAQQHGVQWLAERLDMFYFHGPDTRDDIWGVSLLSSWEILDAKTVMLPSTEALQRVAVVATINIPQPFGPTPVLVTHLSFQSKSDQANQIEALLGLTEDYPKFVLMGDFNLVLAQQDRKPLEEDTSYQLLNDSYIDGWIDAGGTFDTPTSFFFQDDPLVSNARIDYIWLSEGWNIKPNSAMVLGDRLVSDHRAIAITLLS